MLSLNFCQIYSNFQFVDTLFHYRDLCPRGSTSKGHECQSIGRRYYFTLIDSSGEVLQTVNSYQECVVVLKGLYKKMLELIFTLSLNIRSVDGQFSIETGTHSYITSADSF